MPAGGPGRSRPGGVGGAPPPPPPPQPPPPAPAVITALQSSVAALQTSVTALQTAQCSTCIPTPIPAGQNVLGTADGSLAWLPTEEC